MEKFAEDYSKLFQSTCLDKEVNSVCLNIEDMLTRLDELENLLVNVKTENKAIDEQMAVILSKLEQFQILRKRIDKLEAFISIVDNNVDEVEKAMDKIQDELYGNGFNLKDILLKPFIGKNKVTTSKLNAENLTLSSDDKSDECRFGVKIFKTDDYFLDNNKIVDCD